MEGFQKINLLDFIDEIGEEKAKSFLEIFSCPYNADVEDFFKNKAITFARQRLSSVWIVFASYKGEWCLCGYFALAQKHFHIDLKALKSNLRGRIRKFATYDKEINKYLLVAPLIGQLGKNFFSGYDKLITGDELLKIACDTVKQAQRILGGRIVYLEAEDVPALINFYERNGFYKFGQRSIDSDEKLKGKNLIQFLKYLN